MRVSLIAAMDRNRVIGLENHLPWHLPVDLKWFKKNTMGKVVVMGRKTFESIGRPLPGRINMILTRDKSYQADGCVVVHTIEEIFAEIGDEQEVMIIGGGQLFEQLLSRANRLYLTRIDAEFEGDSYFPLLNPEQWRVIWREEIDSSEDNPYGVQFLIVERIHNTGESA
jgi:dihydrofolate reductase